MFFRGFRECQTNEISCWIEVVFLRIVDNPQLFVLASECIGFDAINLATLDPAGFYNAQYKPGLSTFTSARPAA